MIPLRIFISSVQREFAGERAALRDYVHGDPLMRRFFDVFLFEDAPASDGRPDELYLDEVECCDVYVGLFGDDYGTEDQEGVSPTEREFDRATALGKHRLVFVKNTDAGARHPKMQALIVKAQAGLIRKRFGTEAELVAALYAALVEFLEVRELIRWGPFDASPCDRATLDDLDHERMTRFVRTARGARQFPLPEDTSPESLLDHLNLRKNGRLTNAAVLLFGRAPQRFLISSDIKCAHFHGTQVAKPIPSYQVYKGTVFDLVDHAVDFVLGKIALSVGTRARSVQAPVAYEIPKEVVTEAIVNAVAHRDYTNAGSVQVMLFADRLEVWNPGRLPPPLTLEKLRVPHESIPGNPLLARAMYLVKYIEQMGTGTLDMIERCVHAGLREPEFEGSGEFVTRIRRAAPAGQPVVFTGRAGLHGDTGEKAGEQTDPPREETTAPREETTAPREETTAPREETTAPREETTAPREKTAAPREKTAEPREETATPREETVAPREETVAPREETAAPREETAAPREETKGTKEKILALIAADPAITTARMADEIGISKKGIEWQIRRLKSAGRIERIGPDKGGRWRVAGEDDG